MVNVLEVLSPLRSVYTADPGDVDLPLNAYTPLVMNDVVMQLT